MVFTRVVSGQRVASAHINDLQEAVEDVQLITSQIDGDDLTTEEVQTIVNNTSLSDLAVPTSGISMNSQTISNVFDPIGLQDAATKNYVDIAIEGVTIEDGTLGPEKLNFDPATQDELNTVASIANSAVTAVASKAEQSFVQAGFDSLQAQHETHANNTSNPHVVTKAQVGLGNVPDVDATVRSNHTGTQASTTISDFQEAVEDVVGSQIVAGSNIGVNYDDTTGKITLSSTATSTVNALDDLTDVTIITPGTGQFLRMGVTQFTNANIQASDLPTLIDATKIANGNVTNTEFQYLDGVTSGIQGQFTNKQPLDSDLTAIAALSPADNDFIQRKSGAWTSRTPLQVKDDLGLGLVPNVNATARVNHTGTQTASTISNFDTQVRTSSLDQMAVPTASVNLNSQKITNLATPTLGTDATTKDYIDAKTGITPHFVQVNKNNTNQNLSNSSSTIVTFGTEVSDTAGVWDTSTNRYTPGRATRSLFTGQLYIFIPTGTPATGSQATVSVYKNGTTIVEDQRASFSINANGVALINFSFIVESFNSTDYFQLLAWQNSSITSTIAGDPVITHLKIQELPSGGLKGEQGIAGVSGPPIVSSRYILAASQSIPNNTQTNIIWNNVTFTGPNNPVTYNATSGAFTVNGNFSGSYLRIIAKGSWEFGTGRRIIGVYKNGSQVTTSESVGPGATQYITNSVNDIIHASIGDTFEIKAYQNSGAAANLYGSADGSYSSVIFSQEQGGPVGPAGPPGAAGDPILAKYKRITVQSIPNATETQVVWGATPEVVTATSPVSYNSSTGLFTVNPGFSIPALRINARLVWEQSANTGRRVVRIYKNGTYINWADSTSASTVYVSSIISEVFSASPGDTFSIGAYQNSGGAINLFSDATVYSSVTFTVEQGGPAGPAGDVGTTRFIGSVTALGGETSLTLPFPTGVGRNIVLKGSLRSAQAAAADNAVIRFNGDTTAANYNQAYIFGTNATAPTTTSINNVQGAYICFTPASTAVANAFGSFNATIFNYQSTIMHKTIVAETGRNGDSTSTATGVGLLTTRWSQVSAVTSLSILLVSGAAFAAGSTVAVYVEVDAASGEGLPANVLSVSGSSLILASNVLSSPKLDYLYTPTNAFGTTIEATNLNNIGKTGFYEAVLGTLNQPDLDPIPGGGSYWHVYHHQYSQTGTIGSGADYAYQRAVPLEVISDFVAERNKIAGVWQAWRYTGEDVPWTTITLNTYAIPGTGVHVPRYRVIGGKRVQLAGHFQLQGGGDLAGWGMSGNIPGMAPTVGNRYFPWTQQPTSGYLMIQPGGGGVETIAMAGGSGAPPANRMMSLEGLSYIK